MTAAGEAAPVPPEAPHSEAIWQEVECGSYSADLPLWRELAAAASSAGGPCAVLDLGCGTGRVSLALARRGCHVTGLDVDPELVDALGQRAARLGLPVEPVVADARSFELPARFDLVLAPMQFVQLLRSSDERSEMLGCIARHLKRGGRAALAVLDPDDDLGVDDLPPLPDVREVDGWVYASHPVAVRQVSGDLAIEIERLRRTVSPAGEITEHLHSDVLHLLSCERLEQEGRLVGLEPEPRRHVPATRHVASLVVVLRSDG